MKSIYRWAVMKHAGYGTSRMVALMAFGSRLRDALDAKDMVDGDYVSYDPQPTLDRTPRQAGGPMGAPLAVASRQDGSALVCAREGGDE